ncbi:hypothetical protein Hanom_Chr09g00829591 [Helianthus anomalus]
MYLDVLEYYYKYKTVQENVHVKEVVNEDVESSQRRHTKTKSDDMGRGVAASEDNKGAKSEQATFFARIDDGDWNQVKRRKKFNFNYARWAVEEANRSVMNHALKHNQV